MPSHSPLLCFPIQSGQLIATCIPREHWAQGLRLPKVLAPIADLSAKCAPWPVFLNDCESGEWR